MSMSRKKRFDVDHTNQTKPTASTLAHDAIQQNLPKLYNICGLSPPSHIRYLSTYIVTSTTTEYESSHHLLVVVIAAVTPSIAKRVRNAAPRPRRRMHVPLAPASHRAEPVVATGTARPPAAPAPTTAAMASVLVREHVHLGRGPIAASGGRAAIVGACRRGGGVPATRTISAGVLSAPRPLHAHGGAPDDVSRRICYHSVQRCCLSKVVVRSFVREKVDQYTARQDEASTEKRREGKEINTGETSTRRGEGVYRLRGQGR